MMENKANVATTLRPEGDRLLYAPLVEIDLNKFIHELKQETTWANSDHNSITVFKSENRTIVLIGMHANTELKTHKANGHITLQVLEGEVQFIAEKQTISLSKGQMICLQENIPHGVLAMKESFFLFTVMMNDE